LRWSQRPGLFQPFPSLKRSLGPSELSLLNHLEHKVPTRTTTRLVSLVSITSEFDRNKESRKKKAMKGGWLGVFIAPTTKLAVWWG
jgi:hypothetical protein